MNRVILFLAFCAWVTIGRGAGFDQGNDFYAAGKFAEAARAYEAQASQGAYSANLFYNLANADFRLGRRGKAILNYRRALLLDPSHAEAASNLAFIRGGEIPASADSAAWTWAAAAGGWVAVAALVFGRRRPLGWTLGAVGALTCAGGLAAIVYGTDDAANATTAVVLEDKTRTFYAPADSAAVVTTLPAGHEVRILADRGAWLYTRLPDGTRAWAPAAGVERLIPRGR